MIEAARPAGADDLARLVELHRAATAELRAERGGEMWAAVEDRDAPPGLPRSTPTTCSCWRPRSTTSSSATAGSSGGPSPTGRRLAVVTDVYVEPAARGVGLGEALLDLAIAWAPGAGLPRHRLGRPPGDAGDEELLRVRRSRRPAPSRCTGRCDPRSVAVGAIVVVERPAAARATGPGAGGGGVVGAGGPGRGGRDPGRGGRAGAGRGDRARRGVRGAGRVGRADRRRVTTT